MNETPTHLQDSVEGRRIADADGQGWRRWGPYLSDRQWGTVRGDYSGHGDAWNYFRCAALAAGRSGPAEAAGGALDRPQCRYRFNAGQMGISVVCPLGSGIPRRNLCDDRSGFRQGAGSAVAGGPLYAPERADTAYEWAFGDANPPLQSWAAWRIYEIDQRLTGKPDLSFLRKVFNKLLLNFGWWVNRKDANGLNIFQGGFLGLDNIEIFDRSAPLPTGGMIDQVDDTAWMASFALFMLRIALELAMAEPDYEDIAIKFFEHFLLIAEAMSRAGGGAGLWDEEDSFFYDLLRLPSGEALKLRARSTVGLTPMMAVQVMEPNMLQALPKFAARMNWFLQARPELAALISNWNVDGDGARRLLSLLRGHRMKCLLARLLDGAEFLSDYGPRAVSKYHEAHPYIFDHMAHAELRYLPAESDTGAFGGNSNWRGPIWMPINLRLIEAILVFQLYYGDEFVVEYPVGSAKMITLREVAAMLAQRMINLSLKDADGKRPVMAAYPQLQGDIAGQDLVLFHEYYHGDNGRGVGASHQTGWSAAVALLIQMQGRLL